ncbi:MAG TPA: SUMF1/EgtB/PvdO family nonheme iron enzyme [Anaerolineales bacterium]|nr:SUMF1/EgtB/PvdO family nonheme iron enzyme [Anaerolineales bacterium]
MAKIEKTVFISYRRTDISWALAVYQYLTGRGYDVFFDYTSIPSGDFEQIIVGNIKARAHFVLILTPTALDRCSEPGDWLRREIEAAMDERRNIIPLFFDGFSFGLPNVAEKLTGKLDLLKRYNGQDMPSGFFIEAMERVRTQFLSVPLDAVIHPMPAEVQKKVQDEQIAVSKALSEQRKTIQEILKSSGKSGQRFVWSLLLILAMVILGFYGINYLGQVGDQSETESPATGIASIQSGAAFTRVISTITVATAPTTIPTLGIGSTRVSERDGMNMVYIPAGEFEMGSEDGAEDASPVHKVYLDAYWIDQTEVTNAMYVKCVEDGVCDLPVETGSDTLIDYFTDPSFQNFPVINVASIMADDYCAWAGRRLPTEAEWEKAATWDEKTQSKVLFPWSLDMDCSLANFRDTDFGECVGDTMPVGSYKNSVNAYGIYDMVGNVWEFVTDWYDENYYANSPYENPEGPDSGSIRVIRGGSFINNVSVVSPTHRGQTIPDLAPFSAGIRCVVSD